MRSASCILVLFFLIPRFCHADTTWVAGGDVSGIWTADNSPYVITATPFLPDGDTLTIRPEVRVVFDGQYELIVGGVLIVTGSPDSMVWFTNVDSLWNPWGGISFQSLSSDTNRISFGCIEFASTMVSATAGLHVFSGALILANSTVKDCFGHGIQLASATALVMTDCNTRNCGIYSCGGSGGAVYAGIGAYLLIRDCLFQNNHSGDGGAMSLYGSNALIERCVFDGDSGCSSGWGGAIYAGGPSGDVIIRDCIFRNGNAMYGGALLTDGPVQVLVERSVFHDNIAGDENTYGYGGAVEAQNPWLTIRNCTFFHNHSWFNQGAALGGQCGSITNCIFMGHEATAIRFTSGCPVRYNCFFGNGANVEGAQPAGIGAINQVNANGDSCDTFFNIFSFNPTMVDPGNGDFHLLASSPCIDAGDASSPRDPDSTIADIGAFYLDQLQNISGNENPVPITFTLGAYPNPFNSIVRLTISLPEPSRVRLAIYNLVGEEVAVLEDGMVHSGNHAWSWNAASSSSGTYFAVMTSGVHRETRKLLLLR